MEAGAPMPPNDLNQPTGRRKAAILMLSLGPEAASEVYRNLSDREIEQLTLEIANLGAVREEQSREVIEEFYHTAMARQYINHGGVGVAREILEKAMGAGKAGEVIERLQGALTTHPFEFLKHADAAYLAELVQREHPQTAALILSHLDCAKAASVLSALPPEIRAEIALRIANMDRISPEVLEEVERVLEKKMASMLAGELSASGGVSAVAELLNRLDPRAIRGILENLEDNDRELASEVKRRMFTFDDLVMLDDKTLQKILRHIDFRELATALKGAGDDLRGQIYGNLSHRAAETLQDEIDTMGPVRVRSVEESQQKIINLLRQLEESGEIELSRPGGDGGYID